jgi:hypothetical protein
MPIKEHSSFKHFIFNIPRNRIYLILAAIAVIVQFAIFKYFYPFPNFIHGDSFVYVKAAFNNAAVGLYPIGYPKFLRLFSVFSTSDLALTAFQYLFIQASNLAFLFTIFYLYRPGKMIEGLLMTAMVLNPIFLHLANLVSSDGLFMAVSFIWFTLLLWILHRPTPYLIVWHAIVLFLAFILRYNALYYPVISILAFSLSRQKLYHKFLGVAASFLLIGGFIVFTAQEYKVFIGRQVFSPFSGWQLASNALYAYRNIDSAKRKPVPQKFQGVDRIVRTYFDTSKNRATHPMENLEASTPYMWTPESPLQLYMIKEYGFDKSIKDSSTLRYQRWASAGPLLGEYGSWLITEYPQEYIAHYLLPNALKYYTPPVEFLEVYNMGFDSITATTQTWFRLKSNKVTTRFHDKQATTLEFYPIFSAIVNGFFICCILGFFFMIGFKKDSDLSRFVILCGGLWLVNFGFSILASPVALRFQVFTLMAFLYTSLLLFGHVYNISSKRDQELKIKAYPSMAGGQL